MTECVNKNCKSALAIEITFTGVTQAEVTKHGAAPVILQQGQSTTLTYPLDQACGNSETQDSFRVKVCNKEMGVNCTAWGPPSVTTFTLKCSECPTP